MAVKVKIDRNALINGLLAGDKFPKYPVIDRFTGEATKVAYIESVGIFYIWSINQNYWVKLSPEQAQPYLNAIREMSNRHLKGSLKGSVETF